MSLPFYSIECSGCGFVDNYNYGTKYIYEGQPEKKPSLTAAWCEKCDAIITACRPYTKADAGNLYQLSEWEKIIVLGLKEIKSSDRESAEQEFLARKKQRLAYFESNPYLPRCLQCGEYAVHALKLPDEGNCTEVRSGVKHTCGGELLIRKAGRISFASYREIVYNENGEIVK